MRIPNFYSICKKKILVIVNYVGKEVLKYIIPPLFFLVGLLYVEVENAIDVRNKGILFVSADIVDELKVKIEVHETKEMPVKTNIVASKTGKRYYYIWCVASNIKEENKVYFQSEEDAQKTGLTLATRC